MAQYTDMALQYSRLGLDKRADTLFGKWFQNSFGQDVQQYVGVYHPDNSEKVRTDRDEPIGVNGENPGGIPPDRHAGAAAHAAATRMAHTGWPKEAVTPQFTREYPYKVERGEPFNAAEEVAKQVTGNIVGGIISAVGRVVGSTTIQGWGEDAKDAIKGDRLKNQNVLKANLLTQWIAYAMGPLSAKSALKSSRTGMIGEASRGRSGGPEYTVAGFQNPMHNYNVDGWAEDYKLRWARSMGVGEQGGSGMTYKPNWTNIAAASRNASTLGQLMPFDAGGAWIWDVGGQREKPWGKGTFDDARYAGGPELAFQERHGSRKLTKLQVELESMKATFFNQLGPGPRIPVPFRVAINLVDLLQQNILIPPTMSRKDGSMPILNKMKQAGDAIDDQIRAQTTYSVEEMTSDPTDRVFQQLYTHNANPIAPTGMYWIDQNNHKLGMEKGDTPRNPGGSIAGIPVADLQSPYLDKARGLYAPQDDLAVFSFEEDYENNNLDNIQRGMNDNTPGNKISQGLVPAVKNDWMPTVNANQFSKTLAVADQQVFPFLFETINKKGTKRSYTVETAYREEVIDTQAGSEKFKILTGVDKNAAAGGKEHKQFAFFQATLNSISESYNPTWSSKHFFGRTEQIHSYTMTDRTLEVSFSITVDEIRKLQHLYERVLWLAQQTYASYDENGRMKAGPIIKMTIGDMFSNLTGFLRSLSYDWNYLGGGSPKWEITQGLRIPMACNVSLSFTVLHNTMPDRNHNFYPGPMIHSRGMYSKRGNSPYSPWTEPEGDAPLISVGDFDGVKQYIQLDREAKNYVHEVVEPNSQNEMFINQAYNNAWDTQLGAIEFV